MSGDPLPEVTSELSDGSRDVIERAGRGASAATELLLERHRSGGRAFLRWRTGRARADNWTLLEEV